MNESPLEVIGDEKLKPTRQEYVAVWLLLGLLFGLLLAKLNSSEPLRSANDRSRWCTVRSLGDHNTYIIDRVIQDPRWDTIDKVRHENHFYSTKPPLFPTVLAGMYRAIYKVTGLTFKQDTKTVTRILLLLVNLIPFLIAMYCFWGILIAANFAPQTRLILFTLTAFATTLTPYLTVLNNHTVGATSLIIALYAAVKIFEAANQQKLNSQEDSQSRTVSEKNALFILGGFFAALTCCNELPAALFGLSIFLVLLRFDFKRTCFLFVPTALIPLAGFFITNYWATGGWKPFYMYYGTEKYVFEYLGVPSYWSNPQGLDKARDSVPTYMFHCLIGHHGVFSLSPLLLLMFSGFWIGLRKRVSVLRAVHLMGILLTIAIFAFYWKRTENYNYGGVSVALRWVLWLTPFWMLAIGETIQSLHNKRWLPILLIVLGVPSLFSAWSPWQTPWQQPWLYNMMHQQGWIDYSDPPKKFDVPLHCWFRTLPDSSGVDKDYWVEFSDGNSLVLRVEDAGSVLHKNREARLIIVKHFNNEAEKIREQNLTLDTEKFKAGAPLEATLLAWSDTASSSTRADQLTFLRGLPGKKNYREGRTRYLFHPIRKNAFKCRLAATRTVIKKRNQEIRCDLWLNNEVPFGTFRKQISVTTQNQNERILTERKTLTYLRSGKLIEQSE